MATDKQKNYIRFLMREEGMPLDVVSIEHTEIGAPASAIGTSVATWLESLDTRQASEVIILLEKLTGRYEGATS